MSNPHTVEDWTVLAAMERRNPEIQAATLAGILEIPTNAVLASLRRLEKSGFVRRNYRAATETTTWSVQ